MKGTERPYGGNLPSSGQMGNIAPSNELSEEQKSSPFNISGVLYFVRVEQFFRELALVQEEGLARHNNSLEPKTVSARNLGTAFFLFSELF